jgi:hypothetical protein
VKTIWKFEFEVTDDPVLTVPDGAEFLAHVHAVTPTTLWVWAKVDDQKPKAMRLLHVRGTGHPHYEQLGRHLGTVVTADGALVWHVFEEAS